MSNKCTITWCDLPKYPGRKIRAGSGRKAPEIAGMWKQYSLDYLKTLFEENTYNNVKHHRSLKISIKQLREAVVLHEELLKINFKRVFDPNDEPTLEVPTTITSIPTGKRIFDPRDKDY